MHRNDIEKIIKGEKNKNIINWGVINSHNMMSCTTSGPCEHNLLVCRLEFSCIC